MRRTAFKRYVLGLALGVGGGLAVVAGVNALVNPFNLYDGPRITGFNDYKYELAKYSRLSKAAEVRRLRPQCLVLGSSRAQIGFDPSHPAWTGCRAYNLAHNGGTLYEALRYFQHAAAVERPKQVLLALDFLMFNVYRPLRQPGFTEDRLLTLADGDPNPAWRRAAGYELFASLLSWQTLQASSLTVWPPYARRERGPEDGFWEYTRLDAGFITRRGQRLRFLNNEQGFLTENWFPAPRRQFAVRDPRSGEDTYEYLRGILRLAHREQTDLRVLISPAHARQWETLDQAGLWPQFEEWKRALVRINDEEARRAGREPFALWDFSGFNRFSTEEVPAAGDHVSVMRWYWESSHFRKELGDLVFDRVFALHAPDRVVADDFGTLLDARSLEQHLRGIRAAHEHWHGSHPQDVAEIAQLVRATAAWRAP